MSFGLLISPPLGFPRSPSVRSHEFRILWCSVSAGVGVFGWAGGGGAVVGSSFGILISFPPPCWLKVP